MIPRSVLQFLNKWKNKNARKPLVIRGARQVGKTTLVNHFSKSFDKYIYLNLEKFSDGELFRKNDDLSNIIERLFLREKVILQENQTLLIFIDEIQESSFAISQLRYFFEEYPQIHVIAAGSLLDFSLSNQSSFPVGRVEYLYLHPLSFEEFLVAMKQEQLINELNSIPVRKVAFDILKKHFHLYTILGGMPEVIHHYTNTNSISAVTPIYESLLQGFKDDIIKYAKNGTQSAILKILLSIGFSYIDQRVTFQHFGNSNYKSREVSEAFKTIHDSRVLRLYYPTTSIELPIFPDFKKSPRMQFIDTGLVNWALNLQGELIELDDYSKIYKGRIIPHIVFQEIIALYSTHDYLPNFWVRDKNQSSAEVDFLISFEKKLIPVEIKSGATGKLKSLHSFIDHSSHNFAVRVHGGAFSVEQHSTRNGKKFTLLNLPYFAISRIDDYLKRFI